MKEKLEVGNAHFAELGKCFSGEADMEGFFFEPGVVADRAGGIGSEFAEKDPVVDLVTLSLHPIKEPFETDEFSLSVQEDLLLIRREFFKGFLSRDPVSLAGLPQIIVEVLIGGRIPGSKGFLL